MTLKTIHECAQETGVSEGRLRRAVANGKVKGLRLGNRTLIEIEDVQEVLCATNLVKIDVIKAETGLTYSAIRRAVRDGWLPCDKSGRAFLFNVDDVKAAISERMTAPKTEE